MRAILALLITTVAANAGDLEFTYENFQMTQTGSVEVVLKFTNNTGTHLDYAAADCALLDKTGRALTTMAVIATDVPNGSVAYAHNYGPRDRRVDKVLCRLDN